MSLRSNIADCTNLGIWPCQIKIVDIKVVREMAVMECGDIKNQGSVAFQHTSALETF